MTTITIKDNTALSRTIFEDLEDLQEFLSLQFFDKNKEFSDELKAEHEPLKLFQIDEVSISKESLKKIEESINNPNKQ